MELVTMLQEMVQNVAEYAASYRLGQSALRYLDRTLWVVEKCARWAVPPPLDQDERRQPELVRPLPWIFFLIMLIVLRVTRESISLVNLVMGKPPLRSADVVMYIQSKRRYIRTLKYQGNRMMRARSCTGGQRETWYSKIVSLFEFTMCFRRHTNYGNNNSTSVCNNDQVLVVKRSKRGREDASPVASSSVESTMERLIEKMMVDLDVESDEESSYTLTNESSPKSDISQVTIEFEHDNVFRNDSSNKKIQEPKNGDDVNFSPHEGVTSTPEKKNHERSEIDKKKNVASEHTKCETALTPERQDNKKKVEDTEPAPARANSKDKINNTKTEIHDKPTGPKEAKTPKKEAINDIKTPNNEHNKVTLNNGSTAPHSNDKESKAPQKDNDASKGKEHGKKVKAIPVAKTEKQLETEHGVKGKTVEDSALLVTNVQTPPSLKQETINFLQHEKFQKTNRTSKNEKIANGRTVKSVSAKKRGHHGERRDSETHDSRTSENNSF